MTHRTAYQVIYCELCDNNDGKLVEAIGTGHWPVISVWGEVVGDDFGPMCVGHAKQYSTANDFQCFARQHRKKDCPLLPVNDLAAHTSQ